VTKKSMWLTAILVGAVVVGLSARALAAPCSGNDWQPTFVHDLEKPDGPWFVMPGVSFVKLTGIIQNDWTPQACSMIGTNGLRDQRGFTTCQDYTRVQCGCTRSDLSNTTCGAFIGQHPNVVP
jgi:hypothetical protein